MPLATNIHYELSSSPCYNKKTVVLPKGGVCLGNNLSLTYWDCIMAIANSKFLNTLTKRQQREYYLWEAAYGKEPVCSCGFRLPHSDKRLKFEMKRYGIVCFGVTHPLLVAPQLNSP